MSRLARLAEGEELSSNPLRRDFNDLRTTQLAVDVAWRILELFRRSRRLASRGLFAARPADLTDPSTCAPTKRFPRTSRLWTYLALGFCTSRCDHREPALGRRLPTRQGGVREIARSL